MKEIFFRLRPFKFLHNKLRIICYSTIFLLMAYAFLIEPKWIFIQYINLSSNPKHRLVQISDIHYRGDKSYLEGIVDQIPPGKYDLILAGHSHGGQVRLPFIGALTVPYGVNNYDKGLFKTEKGILYVNPGIGTYGIRMRLFCRPEITIIEF